MLQLPKLSVSVHTEKTLHNLFLFARVPLLNYQIFKPLSTVHLISRNMFNVSRVVQEFFKMRWLNCVRGWAKKIVWQFKNSSERKYWKLSVVTESFTNFTKFHSKFLWFKCRVSIWTVFWLLASETKQNPSLKSLFPISVCHVDVLHGTWYQRKTICLLFPYCMVCNRKNIKQTHLNVERKKQKIKLIWNWEDILA